MGFRDAVVCGEIFQQFTNIFLPNAQFQFSISSLLTFSWANIFTETQSYVTQPPTLCALPKLARLMLAHNQISEVPNPAVFFEFILVISSNVIPIVSNIPHAAPPPSKGHGRFWMC